MNQPREKVFNHPEYGPVRVVDVNESTGKVKMVPLSGDGTIIEVEQAVLEESKIIYG